MNQPAKFQTACSACGAAYSLDPQYLGKRIKCPKCQAAFDANPVAASQPAPAQPAPTQPAPQPAASQAADPRPAAQTGPPPGTKRCGMCHAYVPIAQFDDHYRQHQGTLPDGQNASYPTLPPEEQYRGSLVDVPRAYIHQACGAITLMPEEIIRTYLVNPYFYGYSSFCGGCGTHVSAKQLNWTETGENMMNYNRRLQAQNPDSAKYRNKFLMTMVLVGIFGAGFVGLLVGLVGWLASSMTTGFVFALCTFLILFPIIVALLLKMRGGI